MLTPDQYAHFHSLLNEYSKLVAVKDAAEAEIVQAQLKAAEALLPGYSQAQLALSEMESKIKTFSFYHYDELFPDEKRTHTCPFGTVQYRKSTTLNVENKEKSINLINLLSTSASPDSPTAKAFDKSKLLRTSVTLNLEALELLDKDQLALIGITREANENFTVKPFTITTDTPKTKKSKKSKGNKEEA